MSPKKNLLLSLIISLLMIPTFNFAQEKQSATGSNPLFNEFNKPIDFKNITAEHIKEASNTVIENSRKHLKEIIAIPEGRKTFDNTMLKLDDLYNEFNSVNSAIDLLSNVLPNDDKKKAALEHLAQLSKFINELQLNEELYKAVKNYSESKEAKSLTGYKKKMITEVIRNFERSGFALSKQGRDELKKIQDRLSDLSIQFSNFIESYSDSLILKKAAMDGLPDDYLESRFDNGSYKIDLSYPSYYPFMKYSKSEEARKELYLKFTNRSPSNKKILQQLLSERKKMAELLGYKSYAAYKLGDKMAKTPQEVWKFENDLTDNVKPKAVNDYQELAELKKNEQLEMIAKETVSKNSETKSKATASNTNQPEIAESHEEPTSESLEKIIIQPWESSYYTNKLLETKYQLDGEKVKEYFELNSVLTGLFSITQHLFNLEFVEVNNPSVWHEDVRLFEVKRDGKMISRFYLDLFPRPHKYGHAACFGIIGGKMTANGYQYPTAVLVCNFPKPTKDKPSLMPHGDVETFFHEFGHVLHNMLTTSELFYFSGTNVALDFVEAPSQIFENWAWEYDALKLFAKHYKTGEVMPKELFEKMLASKNAGSGLAILQQVFYGTLDMTLHDRFNPDSTSTSTDIVKEVQNKVTLYPYLEGSHMQYAFGHLNGYGAGYYGYLWSKVYAQDMFSVFKQNGIMDQKTGLRYRDSILAKGATEEEINLVKDFLGREPNQNAFLKDLGIPAPENNQKE